MNGGSSGLVTGTIGNPQQSIEQNSYEPQVQSNESDLSERVQFIEELRQSGAKFTEKDIVFITKDHTHQIIWMESGDNHAGLQHIINRHAEDFRKSMGIGSDKIADTLHSLFKNGTICYNRIKQGTNGGFERLYYSDNKYYLLSGIGSNGFIISAYPINDRTAHKLIERYGK